ncbi:MAG: YebC/PmpR family DNA-binding transcriptional regulator [Candidatus Brocadiia bacterium]
MSGHSHWSSIKHQKASADAKRGKAFSKLAKLIAVAVKAAGADPDTNLRLRYAIDAARAANMPVDSIKRAISRASGDEDGARIEEIVYEGYGPGGVAIIVNAVTDNRNRTAPELRKLFEANGGNLGQSGSVSWMFKTTGFVSVPKTSCDEDTITMAALDGGAEDISATEGYWEIYCAPADFEKVKAALKNANIAFETAEITRIASTEVTLAKEAAKRCMNLLSALEDHEDVQNVNNNLRLTDELIALLQKEE